MIALSNIMNALAAVAASMLALALIGLLELSLKSFFIVIALLNGVVTIFFGKKLFYDMLRFLAFAYSRSLYRVKVNGWENLPEAGPALLVCNHLSYLDPVIIFGSSRRRIRFLMDYKIYSIPLLTWIFRGAGAIPICSPIENRNIYQSAINQAIETLKNKEILAIFPEGRLSRDGQIGEFKRGFEKILGSEAAPTYPVSINGLWGSYFSHGRGAALKSLPRLPWYRVSLNVGNPIPSADASAAKLQHDVAQLFGQHSVGLEN